uniref:GTPase HflX n=1 Tax=Eubacterium cellulosolvens (strain ATCC 43171 / JCM 9499 / 6) TaxID=633697 RepID=I5AW12_EUBC6
MYENEQKVERMILAAVCCGEENDTRASLRELAALAETAGACVVGTAIQNRDYPDPGTYMGSGKIEEIREMVIMLDADGVICDDELSPAQMNNLENALDCRVADRTLLILDIFAGRAQTSEGKIQVELAQLKYRQAHLVGMRNYLSRLGGGIGTRGPGEKKLEIDRRLIADRIGALGRELKEVRKHREVLRAARKKGNIRQVAIVGYTNAGKSTLLNTMTNAGVLEEDALFATLDPTTRILDLPGGSQVLLTDTVGFIDKLPHALIDAFRSTLEEAAYADYIIHVADASNPRVEQQMEVVYETLHELGADDKKIVTLFNKQDKTDGSVRLHDHRADYVLSVSAKEGTGLEDLRNVLEKIILEEQIFVERVFPYTEAGKLALIRQNGTLMEEEYREDGIAVKAYVPRDIYGKI